MRTTASALTTINARERQDKARSLPWFVGVERNMSNGEIAYLSLVISGFILFAVCLAGVVWWSRRD